MLSVRNLRKVYTSKKAEEVVALNNVSIEFPETGFVFLLGKSGSGKSTLLNAIGGLDKFDGGEIIIKGKSSKDFSQADFDSYRNTFIGFIFQEYNILENFTVAKNLALALELQGKKADKAEVMKLLNQVEMQDYANRKPNELSGGQKQRVAIARALIKNPEIIMADEPTGALDSNTGKQVMDTLKELSKTKLIIVVSHDREFAEYYGDRIIELKDGKILHDTTRKEIVAEETKSGIKIIDDDIVYIKKGEEISDAELKQIGKIIVDKAKDNDAFISFNKEANAKVKEGAKINDDGNKEKFLKTEPEDVKTKQYNPNSLKLIKSHLGFKDSFKMGASSLKNKVGKLVFTILLSFFAFTCFGIIDTLSCWNRAESVWKTLQASETKTVVLKRRVYNSEYMSYEDDITNDADFAALQEKFTDRTIKAVVGSGGSIQGGKIGSSNYIDIDYSRDPLYSTNISGFINFENATELENFGFSMYKGRLPQSNTEIAISKYTMEALIKITDNNSGGKITEENILSETKPVSIRIGYNDNTYYTIVGVVDDKTDYSKYKEMESEERMKDYTLESYFQNTMLQVAYVYKDKYDEAKAEGNDDVWLFFGTDDRSWSAGRRYVGSLSATLENMNKDQERDDYDYFVCNVNGSWYRLTRNTSSDYDNEQVGDWTIYKINGSYNNDDYNYDKSENKLYKGGSTEVTGEELTAFKTKFGDFTNLGDIPSKFSEGYYTPNEVLTRISYYKGGAISTLIDENGNLKDLEENSVIIPMNMATEFWGADYAEKIEDGSAKLKLKKDGRLIQELTVVGVSNNSNYILSNKVYNEKVAPLYVGCNMMVTVLTGDSAADEKFIMYCEKGDETGKWVVQNTLTSLLNQFEDIVNTLTTVLFYVALVFAVFAAVLLMNFISTSINYKKREIGVLRALGARGSDIFGIFLNESMLIALINFALSAIATVVGCTIINSVIMAQGIEISLLNVGIRQIALILAVSCGSAFIASLLPTSKISKKRPIDAINNR